MNQNQAKTMAASGVAGAIITLIIAICAHYNITISQDVSDAILTLLIAGAGWVTHFERTPKVAPPAVEVAQNA